MSILLSKDDLIALTGYSHKKKQITILQLNNIKYVLDGKGKPVVARAEMERVLVSGRVKRDIKPRRPNFTFLKERYGKK